MTDFARLISTLAEGSVDFILIGGVAATVHGAARLTLDVDIVYDRTPANLDRLAAALAPFDPYPRGAPRGLPFRWDAITIERGLNFTLATSIGEIDLFGEILGGGTYAALVADAVQVEVFGQRCQCLSLERLIAVKRAAGRPKDFEALAELEALREERESRATPDA